MNIEEIRKEMTREEFINSIKEVEDGWSLVTEDNYYECPDNIVGLEDLNNGDCGYTGKNNCKCKECWLKSIENIKFKDEIDDVKLTNDESKKYKASEIISMIENRMLKNDDIIIDKDGDPISIENLNEDTISYLLDCSPFTIKQYIEVPFDEAINALYYQNKNIEVEYEGRKVSFTDNAEFSPTIYQIKEGKWRIVK